MTQYESNKMIQKFMGTERIIGYPGPNDEIPYHQDWALLMPVLDKICRTRIGDGCKFVEYATPKTFGLINEESGEIMVRLSGFLVFKADTLIKATWSAVVDFVDFYTCRGIKSLP